MKVQSIQYSHNDFSLVFRICRRLPYCKKIILPVGVRMLHICLHTMRALLQVLLNKVTFEFPALS